MDDRRNTVTGINRLIELRSRGLKPELVFIMFIDGGHLSDGDVGISPAANIERLDLRPFIGLRVLVMADTWSSGLARLFERLQEFASEIVVTVQSWLPDDLGIAWRRSDGARGMLGEALKGAA